MAAGKINLQKASGGITVITGVDGVNNTEVVLPESGELATKEYVDNGAGATFVANDTRVKTALNASGNAPIFACRAWVNFNGTGTVAIRGSGNVSSITDNGVGDYTVNFTTAMPDTNYCPSGICGLTDNDGQQTPVIRFKSTGITSTTNFSFYTPNNNPSGGGFTDMLNIAIKIVR